MTDPSCCPSCGSDRIRVTRSRFVSSDARGREWICAACGQTFPSVKLTEVVDGTLVSVERIAPLRPSSVWALRRLLEKVRTLL